MTETYFECDGCGTRIPYPGWRGIELMGGWPEKLCCKTCLNVTTEAPLWEGTYRRIKEGSMNSKAGNG